MKRDRETKGKVRIREAAKTEDYKGVQLEDKVRSLDSGRERYGRDRIRDKRRSP